jgi:cytoskeletal protein CcmA (bactofilin family)
MFQKQSSNSSMAQAETVIGPSVKVEGDLKGVGNVLIEGILTGTLTTDKDVTIGEGAQIQANVSAQNATIAGTINGSVTIHGHLTIKATAKISGDINTKTISVESGSRINGHLKMGEMPSAEAKPAQ